MLDIWFAGIFNHIHNEVLTNFFLHATKIGDAYVICLATLILIFIFYAKKKYFYAHGLLIVLMINTAITFALKYVIARPRPLGGIIVEGGFSFPSGHTSFTAAVFGFLVYVIYRYPASRIFKIISISILILGIIIVAISRLYLGVHYTTDVLAGFLVGFLSVTIALYLKKYNMLHKKFI